MNKLDWNIIICVFTTQKKLGFFEYHPTGKGRVRNRIKTKHVLGWMVWWMDIKVILRIAYSNKNKWSSEVWYSDS